MSGVGRASAIVGASTLVSRITGLVRNIVLAAALGTVSAGAADAFAIANQLPYNLIAIISSGLLAGVIVPQIVKAGAHKDGGSAYVSKLLTLGFSALAIATVIAVLAAPGLVLLYGWRLPPETIALAIAFAYWCLPQLLFYGIYALVGEMLNARGVFGPFAWSPIINNLISIAGFGVFIALFGLHKDATGWTPGMVALMGATATGGIIVQAGVLLLFWRRAGLHVRPDFRWRGIGLRATGKLAGWTFLMVIVGQIAGLVQTGIVGEASGEAAAGAALQYAWLVFMVPFSVIVLAIGTPYFTRLSAHVADGRIDDVRADLDTSSRAIGVLMVGSLAAMIAAIIPVSRIFTENAAQAVQFAFVLGAYLVALLPLSVQFVLQRTFYAHNDTRTPFIFTAVQAALVIAGAIACALLLPHNYLAAGLAFTQSLANIVQLALAFFLLRRKIGRLGMRRAGLAYLRFLAAAIPAVAAGWGVFLWLGGIDGWAASDRGAAILSAAVIAAASLTVYAIVLAILRAPELRVAISAIRGLLKR